MSNRWKLKLTEVNNAVFQVDMTMTFPVLSHFDFRFLNRIIHRANQSNFN